MQSPPAFIYMQKVSAQIQNESRMPHQIYGIYIKINVRILLGIQSMHVAMQLYCPSVNAMFMEGNIYCVRMFAFMTG